MSLNRIISESLEIICRHYLVVEPTSALGKKNPIWNVLRLLSTAPLQLKPQTCFISQVLADCLTARLLSDSVGRTSLREKHFHLNVILKLTAMEVNQKSSDEFQATVGEQRGRLCKNAFLLGPGLFFCI